MFKRTSERMHMNLQVSVYIYLLLKQTITESIFQFYKGILISSYLYNNREGYTNLYLDLRFYLL